MIILKGEEFLSVEELIRILKVDFLTIFAIARFKRGIKCARVQGIEYISKKDFLGVLNPDSKADKILIERLKNIKELISDV